MADVALLKTVTPEYPRLNRLLQEQEVLLRQKEDLIARQQQQLQEAQQKIKVLEHKLDVLIKRIFATKSERLDGAQLELLLGYAPALAPDWKPLPADSQEPKGPASTAKTRKVRGIRHMADLPVVEVIIDPAEVQADPAAWRCMDEEVTELLDYLPGRFQRLRTVRRKYVSLTRREEAPIVAALPSMIRERCEAAPGLVAQIITAKFCEHTPLYRQEQIYRSRHQVELPRQKMCAWLGMVSDDTCRHVYREVHEAVFASGYVQIDETPVEYLAPGHGQTKTGYLWVCYSPQTKEVVYHWKTGRAARCMEEIVPASFEGVIQCDGYSAYPSYIKHHPRAGRIILAGCLAHARRYFFEAKEEASEAASVLQMMGELYQLEALLRQQQACAQERLDFRQKRSQPIFERLEQYLRYLQDRGDYLPSSRMGNALAYSLNQWAALEVYLSDGRLEIDNNLVENAIRPTAIGKKNWLFFGDANTGQRSAQFYTLVEGCRRHQIDPFTYLKDLLTHFPSTSLTHSHLWSPKAWAQRQDQKQNLVDLAVLSPAS